jgi:hypothetical protein
VPQPYVYLLGQYLGDGHIAKVNRTTLTAGNNASNQRPVTAASKHEAVAAVVAHLVQATDITAGDSEFEHRQRVAPNRDVVHIFTIVAAYGTYRALSTARSRAGSGIRTRMPFRTDAFEASEYAVPPFRPTGAILEPR